MLGVFPEGPSHARERAKDAAVHGGEMEQLSRVGLVDNRRGLGCQFLEDLVQDPGVKQPRGFAKRAQRRRPNPQSPLNGLEGRSLLQSAKAGNRGTKEIEQQETNVLVVEQLAVAGPVALGAEVPEPRQQRYQGVEVFQTLDVAGLQISSLSSGHDCLLPSRQLPGTHEGNAQMLCQFAWRKFGAEQYWPPTGGGGSPTAGARRVDWRSRSDAK